MEEEQWQFHKSHFASACDFESRVASKDIQLPKLHFVRDAVGRLLAADFAKYQSLMMRYWNPKQVAAPENAPLAVAIPSLNHQRDFCESAL